jgi:hypothetical protein
LIWLTDDKLPAVNDDRPSVRWIISPFSSSESQDGGWVFRNTMIWPHGEMELTYFTFLFLTFLDFGRQE